MGGGPRRILHIDMDAFFASVEQARDPALRGKPVIVGGDIGSRGVVSTASYEARSFGVRSAMPMAQARRLCPHAVYLRGDYPAYRAASREVRAVLESVSPLVEFASIDEAYVDVTGSQRLFGGDDAIAQHIKRDIRERLNLPCTVAIAPNKLVAKVATGLAKPDGSKCILEGEEAAFFAPLPLRHLPGAGPKTCQRLEAHGVQTLGGLAALPLDTLLRLFGHSGYNLREAALGKSNAPVVPHGLPKSISRETTFDRDLTDWNTLSDTAYALLGRAAHALREHNLEAKSVTLKVRYSDFDTRTFSRTLLDFTAVDRSFRETLAPLIEKAQARRAPVRLIGAGLSQLRTTQPQLLLFDDGATARQAAAQPGIDAIRARHGADALRPARGLRRTES